MTDYHLRDLEHDIIALSQGGTPDGDIDRIAWRVVMKVREMQARIDAFVELTGLKESAEALED